MNDWGDGISVAHNADEATDIWLRVKAEEKAEAVLGATNEKSSAGQNHSAPSKKVAVSKFNTAANKSFRTSHNILTGVANRMLNIDYFSSAVGLCLGLALTKCATQWRSLK
jgi:hypothetical protein